MGRVSAGVSFRRCGGGVYGRLPRPQETLRRSQVPAEDVGITERTSVGTIRRDQYKIPREEREDYGGAGSV